MRLGLTALRRVLQGLTAARRAYPQTILPVEIWDTILNFLPDTALLRTACVCRTFNELSIGIYLGRNGLNMGSLTMHSHHLKALNLSYVAPSARSLVCNFWAFDVLRDLRRLLEVIKKSPELTDVSLDWGHNLFRVHIFDNRVPYSPRSLLTTFLDVLSALAHKTPGPVIVVTEAGIFKLRPEDILCWELGDWPDTFRRFGRYRSKMRAKIGFGAEKYSFFAVPYGGDVRSSFTLANIHTVNVCSIQTQWQTFGPFTLMAFPTSSLRLAPTPGLPAAALSTILPHITVPFLRLLYVDADIHPGALSEFVGRHKHIKDIRLIRDALKEVSSFTKTTLCHPPRTLPYLTTLEGPDGLGLIDLLDAFDSPSVSTLRISCHPRCTAAHVAGLKSVLRRISFRTRPITLVLSLHVPSWCPPAVRIPISGEEQTIVGAAYCIENVGIENGTFEEARMLLPWLAMLPALQEVEVVSVIYHSNQTAITAERQDFLRDARAVLPSVVDLVIGRRH
ncbi:hypothetical protein B0H16DRAFT_1883817 [Mycena metata]|uniref:F-box domain-containing protein n=1 Tax=Mycena metata TaxID=1033252 RepID=A0AAD7JE03_9AGAR|nr:hypothetical protein B0H16DRAFT_1883817 [Mycena metata]